MIMGKTRRRVGGKGRRGGAGKSLKNKKITFTLFVGDDGLYLQKPEVSTALSTSNLKKGTKLTKNEVNNNKINNVVSDALSGYDMAELNKIYEGSSTTTTTSNVVNTTNVKNSLMSKIPNMPNMPNIKLFSKKSNTEPTATETNIDDLINAEKGRVITLFTNGVKYSEYITALNSLNPTDTEKQNVLKNMKKIQKSIIGNTVKMDGTVIDKIDKSSADNFVNMLSQDNIDSSIFNSNELNKKQLKNIGPM